MKKFSRCLLGLVGSLLTATTPPLAGAVESSYEKTDFGFSVNIPALGLNVYPEKEQLACLDQCVQEEDQENLSLVEFYCNTPASYDGRFCALATILLGDPRTKNIPDHCLLGCGLVLGTGEFAQSEAPEDDTHVPTRPSISELAEISIEEDSAQSSVDSSLDAIG